MAGRKRACAITGGYAIGRMNDVFGHCTACGAHLISLATDHHASIDTGEGASEAVHCPSLLQQKVVTLGVAALLQRSSDAE